MPDREKVIKGLEAIREDYENQRSDFDVATINRALALLKEQEPVEPFINTAKATIFYDGDCEISVAHCGECGMALEQETGDSQGWKFCPWCGRKVKWNAAN